MPTDEVNPTARENESSSAAVLEASDPDTAVYCEITSRILVVSPRPAALRTLVAELAARCYDVLLLHHADDPLLGLMQGHIVLLDRTGDDVPEAMRRIADQSAVLSLVSPNSETNDKSVVWPCPIRELIDRIQELAGNAPALTTEPHTFLFKDLHLDEKRRILKKNGTKIDLTKMEYELLRTIMAAHGQVLSRDELLARVRGDSYFGGSNAIDVHIRSLRQKLDDDPKNPGYIATVRGTGYRLADL
jgi:two-component system, OmpR family, alkaline phosphatase synthesis response regulator PhoP